MAIGDPMQQKPAPLNDGQPEKHTAKQNRQWQLEVQQRLETPINLNNVNGNLTVTGNATIGGTLGVTGASTLGVLGAGATTLASNHVTGNEQVDGTLGVTGTSTLGTVNAGAVSGSSLTTAQADVHHGSRVLQIPAAVVNVVGGTSATYTPAANLATNAVMTVVGGSGKADFLVPLTVGDRILSVSMYGRTTVANSWSMLVWKKTMTATASTQIGSTQTSGTTSGVDSTLTLSGLTETIVAGTVYVVQFNSGASGGAVYGIEITYDRP